MAQLGELDAWVYLKNKWANAFDPAHNQTEQQITWNAAIDARDLVQASGGRLSYQQAYADALAWRRIALREPDAARATGNNSKALWISLGIAGLVYLVIGGGRR